MCLHYFNTTASIDRAYGSDSSCLVLLPGREGSHLWQCSLVKEGWEWHLGDANLQVRVCVSSYYYVYNLFNVNCCS